MVFNTGPSNVTLGAFTLPIIGVPMFLAILVLCHFIMEVPSARWLARIANLAKWGCWFGAVATYMGMGQFSVPMGILYALIAVIAWLVQVWMRNRWRHLETEAAKLIAPAGD